jgi:GNAT superfamily N-acetyltransferase
MAGPERFDVARLMSVFRGDERRLADALALFVEREDFGYVWLGYAEDELVACCSVGYAISTRAGGIVARVRDLYVRPAVRRRGIATALLDALRRRLRAADVATLEVDAGADPSLAAFLNARGFSAAVGCTFTADR